MSNILIFLSLNLLLIDFDLINAKLAFTMGVDEKCDVYGLRVVALETLVGKHPKEILSSLQSKSTHSITLYEVLDQRLP